MQNFVQQDEVEIQNDYKKPDLMIESNSQVFYQDKRDRIPKQLFKYSPHMDQYKKQFFNYPRQTKQNKAFFDFKAFEQRFRKYGVTYTPQRSLAMPFVLYKNWQQIKGKIKNYTAKFSYFSVNISIYNQVNDNNFDTNLLYENYITSGSFGSICSYEVQRESVNFKFMIKLLKFYQTPWQVIYSAIKQYAFMKVFAALKIGPDLESPFGFDILTTSSYAMFSMEKGIVVEDFLYNLASSQKKIKFYLDSLEEQIKILHYFSIVHVDIKPQNIIYSPNFQKLVFIDFGLTQALQFPIGTVQLVTFRGSFFYCSQQMKHLFSQGGYGYVDMYYNDIECWRNTKQYIQANENNKSFCLSSQMANCIKESYDDQSYILDSVQFRRKNQRLHAYFEKVNIVFYVHTNTKQGFQQWFIEHDSLKKMFWKDDAFFYQIIQTYNLKEIVHKSSINDPTQTQDNHEDQIQKTPHQKQNQQEFQPQPQQNNEAQKIIKLRYNDEYFLENQNIDEVIQNIQNQSKSMNNHLNEDNFDRLKKMPIFKLKQIVLKIIINQFDFFKGIAKDGKQFHNYLLQTIKLILNQEQSRQVEALSYKELVKYCIDFAASQILNFLQNFSVHQIIYRFMTQEIDSTNKIKKFAQSIQPQNLQELSQERSYDLSFFYYDLQKYVIFLINKIQAQPNFIAGYSLMQKIKQNFQCKVSTLKQIWQSLDSKFIYSLNNVKEYLNSQIVKTYVKQSLMRCSYFYCKLISVMFLFAQDKNDLAKMKTNLFEVNTFLAKCKQSSLLGAMLVQEPVFIQYKIIMKMMYVLYIVPSTSYGSINIRKKVQNRIDSITKNRQKLRKDQFRHLLFILHTIYIPILASENRFTDMFIAIEKCFQIVRNWRCEFLFVNVINIMIRFNNEEIIRKAQKYLNNIKKNAFSSITYCHQDVSIQPNQKFLIKNGKKKTLRIHRDQFLQQHLQSVQKFCNFKKLVEFSSQAFAEYQKQKKQQIKLDNLWISKYCQVLQKIEQKAQIYLKIFQQEVDAERFGRFRIFKNNQHLQLTMIDIKMAKQMATIQFILFHSKYIEHETVLCWYERLKQLQFIYDPFKKPQIDQGYQKIDMSSLTQYLDIIYIKVEFLNFVQSLRDYKLLKLMNEQKDVMKKAKRNFKRAFEYQCFIIKKNDLKYLQTYVKIINHKITALNIRVINFSFYSGKQTQKLALAWNGHNQELFIYFKNLEMVFFYMNSFETLYSPINKDNQSEKSYLPLIFTLDHQYVEMCLNLCKYYTEQMKKKFQTVGKNLFSQYLNEFSKKQKNNREQHKDKILKTFSKEFNLLNINFQDELNRLIFLFESLTQFSTKYPCKNYSQFIFGVTNGFVSSFELMKINLIGKLTFLGESNKSREILFAELDKQFLEEIECMIIPEKMMRRINSSNKNMEHEFRMKSYRKYSQSLELEGYSKEYLQLLRVKQQIMDQRRNRQIIFVSFFLLKAVINNHPQKVLKLVKLIICRQMPNLYSYSRKLIGQSVKGLVFAIYSLIIEKFNQKGIQIGISVAQFSKMQNKILIYQKKLQKEAKINEIFIKRMKSKS